MHPTQKHPVTVRRSVKKNSLPVIFSLQRREGKILSPSSEESEIKSRQDCLCDN
jgi:hypothetical protein